MYNKEREIVELAQKRVKKKKKFLKELLSYGMTVAICFFINAFTGGYPWFFWVAGPWGIILLFRGISLWSGHRIDQWEEKEMEKEIERYNNAMLRSHRVTDDEYLDIDDIPVQKEQKWRDQDLL